MAKTPDTPAPANAGHNQRQGSASGDSEQPEHAEQEERGSDESRRPAAMEPVRPAREEQDRRQGRGVEDGEESGGRGGARSRFAVDGGEPGDQQVVDDALGGEQRRADPGLAIPPGRPCGGRRALRRNVRLSTSRLRAPGTHHGYPGDERNPRQHTPERQRQAPGGGLPDPIQDRSGERRGDDRAADQPRGVDPRSSHPGAAETASASAAAAMAGRRRYRRRRGR